MIRTELDPVQLSVLALVLTLIITIIITVVISTSTDSRIDPVHYRPLIRNQTIQWALVGCLGFINIGMWVKVVLRWLGD